MKRLMTLAIILVCIILALPQVSASSCGSLRLVRSCDLPGGNGVGIAYAEGSVWVGNHAENNYREESMDCEVLGAWFLPGSDSRGMTFDGTYLWNTDVDCGCAYSFLPRTSTLHSQFPLPSGSGELFGFTWDPDRDCFWHLNTDGTLFRLSPAGDVLESHALGMTTLGIVYESPGILWITVHEADLTWSLYKLSAVDYSPICAYPFGAAEFPDLQQAAGLEKIGDDFWVTDQKTDKIWVATIEGFALDAVVDLDPNTLNVKSKGNDATCYVELPAGYDPADIDVSTVLLDGTVPALSSPTDVGDYDMDGIADRMVKFSRGLVIAHLSGEDGSSMWAEERGAAVPLDHGEVFEMTVSGQLLDGTPFSGRDDIRVINPGQSSDDITSVRVSYPSADEISVSYSVASEGPVTLRIYDAAGRLVKTIDQGQKGVGVHQATWDSRNADGGRVGAGVYFIAIHRGGETKTAKTLIVR